MEIFFTIFGAVALIAAVLAILWVSTRPRAARPCRPVDFMGQLMAHSNDNIQKVVVCGDYGRVQWGPDKNELGVMLAALESDKDVALTLPGCTGYRQRAPRPEPRVPEVIKIEGLTELGEAIASLRPAGTAHDHALDAVSRILHEEPNKEIAYCAPGVSLRVKPVRDDGPSELILTADETRAFRRAYGHEAPRREPERGRDGRQDRDRQPGGQRPGQGGQQRRDRPQGEQPQAARTEPETPAT